MDLEKPDLLQSGDRFHGYVVERLLGKGGLGAVYLVRHEMLDTLYALKILYPEVAKRDFSYVRRFLREAKLATRIRHPNLIAVHDCGRDTDRDLYYLVMDYVSGGDLRSALAFSGRFDPAHAVRIVLEVASALSAAQKYNVVHRDIKPENIMLQQDGSVKLVDLGIAKASDLGDTFKTTTENMFGTPSYIPPEQAMNSADVDIRADIYSLGIVLYELLTGRSPYSGKNSAQILAAILSDEPTPDVRDAVPDISQELAILVRRMTAKDRERRIPSYTVLFAEFTKLGYDLGPVMAPKAEYTPTVESERTDTGLGIDLDKLPENNPTLSFETEDAEIKVFVANLKKKRLRKKIAFIVTVAVLAAILIILIKGLAK